MNNNFKVEILETERLSLRPWQLSDLDDFYEYAKNPNVGPKAGWEPHTSKEITREILQLFMERKNVWAMICKENGKVIGSIGLHEDKKRADINAKMIGYVLSETYWGKGLMSEAVKCVINYAFLEMKLDLISVYHYPSNNPSKSVIEKCGFSYEGTLRCASTIYDGTIKDDVCYSITRNEYYDRKN